MKALRKKIAGLVAITVVVFGAGVANAAYFDVVSASFDREFSEPAKPYDFSQVVASWDRLLTKEKQARSQDLALRSYERLLGEGVFVKNSQKLGEYELALAGWENTISKRELCGDASPVLVACAPTR